eukprot:scaffold4049_cov100-Skeletonema_dohrnii-CCMP3373.AAC.2
MEEIEALQTLNPSIRSNVCCLLRSNNPSIYHSLAGNLLIRGNCLRKTLLFEWKKEPSRRPVGTNNDTGAKEKGRGR